MKNIERKSRELELYTLVAVTEVHCNNDRDLIVGRWEPIQPWFTAKGKNEKVLEHFANWGNDCASIVEFTTRYGHLLKPADAGEEFQFSVTNWQDAQKAFRALWNRLRPSEEQRPVRFYPGESLGTQTGEQFGCVWGQFSYRVSTLYRLLQLELFACPHDHLRFCKGTRCKNPYFVARDRKRAYCSKRCAQLAQRQSKLNYYRKAAANLRMRKQKRRKAKI